MKLLNTPIFDILRTKMNWLQERQHVLAENVANANTPNYQARDLEKVSFGDLVRPPQPTVSANVTHASHIPLKPASPKTPYRIESAPDTEVSPSGNSVVLEDQMLKISANQADFQAATNLYTKGIGMLRIALGGGQR